MHWIVGFARTSTILLVVALVAGAHAQDGNFISTFVRAKGGCREQAPLLVFDFGARRGAEPFGKAAEDWTDDDLRTLRAEMALCVPNPNGFDLGQEKQILRTVSRSVEDARRSRRNREQQAVAARRMAEERVETNAKQQRERHKRREESAALRELEGFSGHVMSQAERDRALQLKESVPGVAEQVDRLLMVQSTLQRQADEERKREDQRRQAAQRIEAEKARRALEEARARQEAEIAAERRREKFVEALPPPCKEARREQRDLGDGESGKKFERAVTLAEAGDIKAACTTFIDYATKMERVRADLVECTKALDPNLDDLAREEALRALNLATETYSKQKLLNEKITELSCR